MKDIRKSCYCGQSGAEHLNMLCCVKCKRWFHEECVACLDAPMLLGDRFYIFVCSVCNAGSECLARIELTWNDLVYLVLYNLTMSFKKKYFHLDSAIIPYIVENWERLRVLGPVAKVKSEEWQSKVLEALHSDSRRFKSGREIKKSKHIFGLRDKDPLEAPTVYPSATKVQNDTVVWEFQVKGRAYHILTCKKSKSHKETAKNGKSKMKVLTKQLGGKQVEVQKCRGGPSNPDNGIHKSKNKVKRLSSSMFCEESACKGLLDSLIPIPSDFIRENNPFHQSVKRTLTKRTKPSLPNKRKYCEIVDLPNGRHKPSTTRQYSQEDCDIIFNAKDFLILNGGKVNSSNICIVGKRVTSSGKTQYLLQQNRPNGEREVENEGKRKLCAVTFRHHCDVCYTLYDSH